MMELITQTARLVPYAKRPKQGSSFVTALAIEPAPDDPAAHLGNLFIVLEVLVSGRPGEDIAAIITENFQTLYYAETSESSTSLNRFEAATKATNAALGEAVNQGNAAWIGKLSAVVAVQCGPELHLTHCGSAEAYLYRHASQTRITAPVTTKPAGPTKTFGLVASGELESGDRLVLATPALIHQLALKKLHSVVSSTNPNAAIAELTDILQAGDSNRIAALVIQILTPDAAALQVRTEEPSEIMLGAPETPLEAAKVMAAPLAEATVQAGKKTTQIARAGWIQTKPAMNRVGLSAAKAARAVLSGDRLAKRILALTAVIIIAGFGYSWYAGHKHTSEELVTNYVGAYTDYQASLDLSAAAKQQRLTNVQTKLTSLQKRAGNDAINAALKTAKLPTGAPTQIQLFMGTVASTLDQLEGLKTVSATTVVSFDSKQSQNPTLIEVVGDNIYALDIKKSAILVVNKTTKSIKLMNIANSKLGTILSETVSSSRDGLYLTTDTPGVWFYRFQTGTMTQISSGLSGWETATASASYNGNLYLLTTGQVLKHVQTSTGFATGTNYLAGTTVPNPIAICVNGYVYVAGSDGLYQYLGGVAKTSQALPSGLAALTSLKAVGTNTIVGVSRTSGRLGIWNDTDSLRFDGQYKLSGTTKVYDAAVDATTGQYYVLADNRIVTFVPAK